MLIWHDCVVTRACVVLHIQQQKTCVEVQKGPVDLHIWHLDDQEGNKMSPWLLAEGTWLLSSYLYCKQRQQVAAEKTLVCLKSLLWLQTPKGELQLAACFGEMKNEGAHSSAELSVNVSFPLWELPEIPGISHPCGYSSPSQNSYDPHCQHI